MPCSYCAAAPSYTRRNSIERTFARGPCRFREPRACARGQWRVISLVLAVKRDLMVRLVVASVSWLLLVPAAGKGQACAEPHYRWSEKVDTTLQTRPATPVDIAAILTDWAPLSLTSKDRCAPRVGREDGVFTVVGWVRRLRLHEADGDWHIELTEARATPVGSCIIVEIPAERYGVIYSRARAALAALVDTTQLGPGGDLRPPVRGQFTAAAFFDGFHQRAVAGGPPHAIQHGRCNSSLRALWELHPIYGVAAPG